MEGKLDIRSLTREEIRAFFVANGDRAFRGDQLYDWLWKKGLRSFQDMTNLSKTTRELLESKFVINNVQVDDMQRSTDGTIKNGVKLHDGRVVESVLIPTEKRITACISSQVGCSLDCTFCATARLKRMRNLNPDEIFDQVVTIRQQAEEFFNRPLTNIVMMGMGEPLLNYQNVMEALHKITTAEGLNMAPRRITLSTVGIAKMIRKMADDGVKFKLAVSLHAAIEETRSRIMSINNSNPLPELMEALQYWYAKTRSRITFEYVVWKNINDDDRHIDALVQYCKKVPCKVNIIEYNPIDDGPYQQADPKIVDRYKQMLENSGIKATIRRSRGKDIAAACGQLANKNEAVTEVVKK